MAYTAYSTIKEWVSERESFSNAELMERFGYTARSATNLTQRLRRDGLIENVERTIWKVINPTGKKPALINEGARAIDERQTPHNIEQQEKIKGYLTELWGKNRVQYLESVPETGVARLFQAIIHLKDEKRTDLATLLYNTERAISDLEKDNPKWIPTVTTLTKPPKKSP